MSMPAGIMCCASGVPDAACDERKPSDSSFCGPRIPAGIIMPAMPPDGMPGIDIVRVPTSTP